MNKVLQQNGCRTRQHLPPDSVREKVAGSPFGIPATSFGGVPLNGGKGVKVVHVPTVPHTVERKTSAGGISIYISSNTLVRISEIRNSVIFLFGVAGIEVVDALAVVETVERDG